MLNIVFSSVNYQLVLKINSFPFSLIQPKMDSLLSNNIVCSLQRTSFISPANVLCTSHFLRHAQMHSRLYFSIFNFFIHRAVFFFQYSLVTEWSFTTLNAGQFPYPFRLPRLNHHESFQLPFILFSIVSVTYSFLLNIYVYMCVCVCVAKKFPCVFNTCSSSYPMHFLFICT